MWTKSTGNLDFHLHNIRSIPDSSSIVIKMQKYCSLLCCWISNSSCRTESAMRFGWFFLFYVVNFHLPDGYSFYFFYSVQLISYEIKYLIFVHLFSPSFTLASASLLLWLLLKFSKENLSRMFLQVFWTTVCVSD